MSASLESYRYNHDLNQLVRLWVSTIVCLLRHGTTVRVPVLFSMHRVLIPL